MDGMRAKVRGNDVPGWRRSYIATPGSALHRASDSTWCTKSLRRQQWLTASNIPTPSIPATQSIAVATHRPLSRRSRTTPGQPYIPPGPPHRRPTSPPVTPASGLNPYEVSGRNLHAGGVESTRGLGVANFKSRHAKVAEGHFPEVYCPNNRQTISREKKKPNLVRPLSTCPGPPRRCLDLLRWSSPDNEAAPRIDLLWLFELRAGLAAPRRMRSTDIPGNSSERSISLCCLLRARR